VAEAGSVGCLAVSDASSFADIKIDQAGRLVTNTLGAEAYKRPVTQVVLSIVARGDLMEPSCIDDLHTSAIPGKH
jgi:hypothetical protein